MLFRPDFDSRSEAEFDAAIREVEAHATPQSVKDFNRLSQLGLFTQPEQVELLHYAAILLREQGRVEEVSKQETLRPREFIWAALYPHLRNAGYILPHRYAPFGHVQGSPVKPPGRFDRPLSLLDCNVLPAIRADTGDRVVLKMTCSRQGSPCAHELEILRLLNTEPLRSHPDNAAIQLLDAVAFPPIQGQPRAADLHILVMPMLRILCVADCAINGFALHLMKQTFRTVAFLHSIGICHRDIGRGNLMMASTESIPYQLRLIDFGYSQQFDISGGSPSVQWIAGQIPPPEVVEDHDVHYDPFKAEIFALSETWNMQRLHGMLPEATVALLDRMAHLDPAARPSAAECVRDLEASLAGVGLIEQLSPTRVLVSVFKLVLLDREERDLRDCAGYAANYLCAVGLYIVRRGWNFLR
ncbi:hypothetical protein AURDEDRAFT_160143 [Auricularia subglabra TFB-10046 SS5]|nr:hypothetical protein AURDEDRAFT_160143 [Auricularia subglabra TFB-10046 SS5]